MLTQPNIAIFKSQTCVSARITFVNVEIVLCYTGTGRIMSDKVVRYFNDKLGQKTNLINKLKVKNGTLKVQRSKFDDMVDYTHIHITYITKLFSVIFFFDEGYMKDMC